MKTKPHNSKITKVRYNIHYRNMDNRVWQSVHDLKRDKANALYDSLTPIFDEVELYKVETTLITSSMIVARAKD